MLDFLNKTGLTTLLNRLDEKFGRKATLDQCITIRNQFLKGIDYEKDLAFNKELIIGEAGAPYVGQAMVGSTYVA